MATEIFSCPRCNSTPAVERIGSYWRIKCLNHAVLPTLSLVGHTMKTKGAAIAEWNRMTAEHGRAAAETSRANGGSET